MAKRITYPEKTNNPSDPDSVNKYHYNEANEVKEVAEDHAERIEDLESKVVVSSNPFYGRYTSLSLLQAAYPEGVDNGWAVIDEGVGITPKIAFWDTDDEAWVVSGNIEQIIYVNTSANLPAPGTTQKLYITTRGDMYVWLNGAYTQVNSNTFASQAYVNATVKAAIGAPKTTVSATWAGTGFNFNVTADIYPIGSTFYTANPDTVTLDASHATLDRIDLIVAIKPVDDFTAGTVGKITGTPATPELVYPPDYDPDLYYVIREVHVKAASTQPDTVADILMYAENAGQPTEATVTENTGGLRINPADSITPITGTYSIGCADLESGDALTLTLASSNVIADLASFVFDLKINAYTSALHKNSIQVTFENASGAVAHIKLVDGDGFDASLIGVAQTIKIYEYNFYIFQKEDMSFDRVRFYFDNIVDGTDQMSLQLDNIDINLDSGESTPSNNYVTEANANNTPYVRINNQWSDLFNHIPRIGKRVEMGDSSNIDWSAGDTFTHNTLTAPLVLTESNLPARSGTKTISSYFTGEQPITVPANWIKEDDTDYDGTVMNRFVAECVNGNSGSELIYYSIKPMI